MNEIDELLGELISEDKPEIVVPEIISDDEWYTIKRCNNGNYPYKVIEKKTGRVVGSSESEYLAKHNIKMRIAARRKHARVHSKSEE